MDGSEDDLFVQNKKEKKIDENEREIVNVDSNSAKELDESKNDEFFLVKSQVIWNCISWGCFGTLLLDFKTLQDFLKILQDFSKYGFYRYEFCRTESTDDAEKDQGNLRKKSVKPILGDENVLRTLHIKSSKQTSIDLENDALPHRKSSDQLSMKVEDVEKDYQNISHKKSVDLTLMDLDKADDSCTEVEHNQCKSVITNVLISS
ncbi:hypothetical protein C1645_837940 [Glomus cerebriforme]|uniref:Uncharacterized protein n=1 Tax=Glomus cerebriforme TaxID=658196 RepID=A0A397S7U3_9GLOM|nr:hypothetical protein C1645_837940 [Glomus cerebriforme]